jgi:hypothetical protein
MVRCFPFDGGNFIGSCNYDDLCHTFWLYYIVLNFSREQKGLSDLYCPYTINAGYYDNYLPIQLPDLRISKLSFLSFGDYEVQIRAADDVGFLGCMNFKFTVNSY